MSETVMIVAGETSGELYGALLAAALREKRPDLDLIGIGGERMREAGVTLISGISSAFGFVEVIASVREFKRTFQKAVDTLSSRKPSVLVLIDYPDFNLKLAERAKSLQIKVLYYVSPQVWVWRKNRIHTIARLVDKMAVILPFEEKIYRDIGVDCEFVGHPVLDELQGMSLQKEALEKELGLRPGIPLISLLPGSRTHEINKLLPVMTEVIRECRQEFGDVQFCIPFAQNTDMEQYRQEIRLLEQEGVRINQGKAVRALAASDCAVVASGTASLQAVLLGIPLVVIYKVSALTFWIGMKIITGKYMTLANILSDREIVREFLQKDVSVANISNELRRLMTDSRYREDVLEAYGRVREMFSSKKASDRVSDMVLQLIGSR
ncbi:MAG: lipid-A-disaccharide synthase [Thermodesulfovibrionales bacterium]